MATSRRAQGLAVVLDALAPRFGGGAYAVLQLVTALERRDDVARVVVIAQCDSIVGRGLRASPTVEPVLLRAPPGRAELVWRIAWQIRRLPSIVAEHRADVLFSFSGMVPRKPDCAVIALLGNQIPYMNRSNVFARLRRAAIHRTLRSAAAAYVPSEGMRQLIGAPMLKVVPMGVDHASFRPSETIGTDLLYVGDFYAHKRHDLILDAWNLLPEPRPRLRLIGNPAVDPVTFAAVEAAALDPRIVVEGRVPFNVLRAAYGAARVLVLPSQNESFGMPIAEAMASGAPAVIRDDPILRETAGPGGLPVASDTPEEWARTIDRVLRDDALHASLRTAGLAHSRRYSWDAMAAEIVSDGSAAAR